MTSAGNDVPNGARTSSSPWWKAIVEVSAFFAVIAGTVYVVGLFALWIPLATQVTQDFSTSWYAISLIPHVTVVGQGIRTLLGWPVLTLLIFVTIPWAIPLIAGYVAGPIVRILIRPIRKPAARLLSGATFLHRPFHFLRVVVESLGTRPDWETFEEYAEWLRPQLKGLMVVYLVFVPVYYVLLDYSLLDCAAWVVILFGSS